MGDVNCLRCKYRHTDNGNCTAVGGFCTAVQAAHCPLLREYLDTVLEPAVCANYKTFEDEAISKGVPFKRIVALMEADRAGRLAVLPCKPGDTVYFALLGRIIEKQVFSIVSFSNSIRIYCDGTSEYFRPEDIGKTFFLTREEAALRKVERRWKNGEYILDADNFQGVDFWAADHPPVKHIDAQEKIDWFELFLSRMRDYSDGEVWGNGDELMCKTEAIADAMCDLLFQLYAAQGEEVVFHTGYYDPAEDARSGEEDRCTGWWYVDCD